MAEQKQYLSEEDMGFGASSQPSQYLSERDMGMPDTGGTMSDLGKSVKVGVQKLPGMLAGLADLPVALTTGFRPFTKAADVLGDVTGFQPGKWADETQFSQGHEDSRKQVDAAWDKASMSNLAGSVADIAGAYAKNPSYTLNQVAESLPSMAAGGVGSKLLMGVGRVAGMAADAVAGTAARAAAPGLLARTVGEKWAVPIAAGVGEGAVTAGQQMAEYKGDNQQKNALASLGAGLGVGLIGAGAGRLANHWGLETAETAMARAGTRAGAGPEVPLSLKRRVLGGMVSEAVLQELPQSAQEQMWNNFANGKPLMEGVARAGTEGALAGGVMGAGANLRGRGPAAPNPAPEAAPAAPEAPPLLLGNTPDPLISFPDGTVGRRADVDAYVNGLPENQQVAARASLMGYGAQPAPTPSEAMGIDPAAGPLSRGAAQTVDSGAYMPPADQAAPAAPEPDPVVLQNRDRTSAASIAQMQDIAANPDYLRVGPSRDMTSGAPVVFGELPQSALLGRPETVVDGKGERMGTQYAVVDAGDLIASNNADGTAVAEYATGAPGKLRAVAGNGRTAGLQAAYQMGTADNYRQELANDAAALGLDPQAIATMENPVLVRVMQSADVTDDMGDRTNIPSTQDLSPREQAANDSRRIDIRGMSFDEDGAPTLDSLVGFISKMPTSESGKLTDSNNQPSRQAIERFRAATFHEAYRDPGLVELYATEANPQAKSVLRASADAAGVMANLRGAGEFDITESVTEAIKMAVNAARQGVSASDLAATQGLGVSDEAHAETRTIANFLTDNKRSAQKMAEGLRRWGKLALDQARIADENTRQGGMFGAAPTLSRQEIFARLGDGANPTGQGIAPAGPAAVQPAPEQAALMPAPQSPQSSPNADPNDTQADQAQQATPQQPQQAEQVTPAAVQRHPNWRKNAIQAGRVARDLGIDPSGQRLAQIVADIDAHDAAIAQPAPVPEAPQLDLAAYTAEEGRAAAQAQEAADQRKAQEDAAFDAAEKVADERKRIAQASEIAADDFQLGQNPMDSLTGQEGMFDTPAAEAKPVAAQDTAVTPAKPAKPAKKPTAKKKQEHEAKLAAHTDYFTPGNVVKSYAGHERVVSYSPPDANGVWSVTAQPVELQGDKWVDVPGAKQSQHSTQPDARALKAGPVMRAPENATENIATTARIQGATGQNDADLSADGAAYSDTPSTKAAATALDKEIMGMANDGRSARDILRAIQSGSKSKLNRQVAALLLKMQAVPKVEAVGRIYNGRGHLVSGVHNGKTDTVQLSLLFEAGAEYTFMHEMVHAATVQSLRRGGMAAQRMKALFARVQKDSALAGEYGVTDVYEFAAELYSNERFRNALNTINEGTLWQNFVNIVRSILGLSADQRTALSNALMAGQQVMAEDKAIRASAAERAGGQFNAAPMNVQPQDFVPNADGGLDYGEITPEMGKVMRRQAGKIRLRHGDDTQGLVHIEAGHLEQFKRLGFESAQEFISSVAQSFTAIYKRDGAALDVVLEDGGRGRLMVQLEMSADGDFYDVKTASPIRADQFKNREPLWERTGTSAPVADKDNSPSPESQSGSASVAPKASGTNPDVRFSRATSSVPESAAEWLSDTVIADEVENRISSFAHQPPIRIRDTAFGQLPGVARNDNVAGAVHDGAIYLFRDQLGDREAVQRTLFHELLHYGLRKLLTKAQFTSQMLNLYHRDKAIKDEADRWAATADGARAKAQGGSDYALARGVDEALAVLAEPNGGAYLNQTARSMFVRRVTRWLANVAQFLGMDKAAAYLRSIKNEEAREYVQSIFSKLASEATGKTADWSDTSEPAFSRAAPAQPTAIQSSMGELTPEQARAYQRVAGTKKVPTLKERFAVLKANFGLKARQALVDQFAAIKQLDQHAYMQARMSKASDGTLEAALLYGKPFMNGGVPDVNMADGGFAKVLASLDGEHDRLLMWVAAQRADRLKAEGKENLMTDDDISSLKTLNAGKMKDGRSRPQVYAKALGEINAYNEAMLKIGMESGLIDQAAYDIMKDQPYVPFYRLMEDDGIQGPRFSSGLTNQQAFKKLKGGSQQLNADLLENMLLSWSSLLQASAKNRAALASMDAAEKMAIAYKVPATTHGKATKGAVKVMRDGVTEHWMVEDPYLLEAIGALHYTVSPLMKPLVKMKQILTMAVTVNPTFKIRNLIRDSLSAIAQSELGYNPAANVKNAWKLAASDSQIYASMLAGGGIIKFGTQENTDRLRAQVAKLGGTVLDKTGTQKLMGQVGTLWEIYSEFGDRTENVNRVALYDQLVKNGKSHAEASFMARDLMDFSMGGGMPLVRFLTQTVPFLNARLVGLDKLGRAAMEDPRKFATVAAAVSIASVALMMMYGDDDDWKRREDWDRDTYWWFKVGDKAFRIPKPFEVGAIGTMAERTAELMFSKEMTNKRFAERMAHMFSQTFAFDPVPQAIKPLWDVYSNKDSFTKRAIESQADQRLRPEDRYNERTSEVARLLGQLGLPEPSQLIKGTYVGLSPKQIDHLIRGYFSWVGVTATTAADMLARPALDRGERPALRLKDAFVIGNFVESLPTGSSRYVSQMYEQSRQVQQAYASYREAVKLGDMDKARSIQAEDGDKLRSRIGYDHAAKQLSEINQRAKKVEADRSLSAADKRERLDALEQRRGAIAKRAVERAGV